MVFSSCAVIPFLADSKYVNLYSSSCSSQNLEKENKKQLSSVRYIERECSANNSENNCDLLSARKKILSKQGSLRTQTSPVAKRRTSRTGTSSPEWHTTGKILPKYELEHEMLIRMKPRSLLNDFAKAEAKKTHHEKKNESGREGNSKEHVFHGKNSGKQQQKENSERKIESENFMMRTSELDPSIFQIEIPSLFDLYMHGKLCVYARKATFDQFSTFPIGISFSEISEDESSGNGGSPRSITSFPCVSKDLVLEDRFHGKSGELGDVKVSIFSIQKYNRVIVCLEGSPNLQLKPVPKKHLKDTYSSDGKESIPESIPGIFPFFSHKFFQNGLEESIFRSLIKILSINPFSDIVVTGHSFGAALATIGATTLAARFPSNRVSCHAFGSPRVGNKLFRSLVHSFPNLKVFRIENGTDPYVATPEASDWIHVGHTIRMDSSLDMETGSLSVEVQAYKFDKRRPTITGAGLFPKCSKGVNIFCGKSQASQAKCNHEMESYVQVLKTIKNQGSTWVNRYVGEEGNGVSGIDNEDRYLV